MRTVILAAIIAALVAGCGLAHQAAIADAHEAAVAQINNAKATCEQK